MSSPTLKVEIAFTSDPLDITPTWVDVSAYVRATAPGNGGVYIRRGRSSELDRFEAGTCSVTLSNRDRRFDPSYAAGPYFGNLIPRKQIRVTATWATVDYVMFTGWVTGWPQGFDFMGKDATVTIEAIDALAWLANNNLPDDLVYSYAEGLTGLAFFLRGADTSSWSDATSNGYSAALVTGIGRTSSPLAPGMSSNAVATDGASMWSLAKTYTSAGAWSLSVWFVASREVASSFDAPMLYGAPGSGASSILTIDDDGAGAKRLIYRTGSPVGDVNTLSSIPLDDGLAHHAVVTSDGSTVAGYRIYIDGVDATDTTLTSGSYQALVLNWAFPDASIGVTSAFVGSLQDVAVWDQELSAAEVEALYQRSYGFLQEASADRVTRLLDDVGWPASWRDITTNPRASVGELVYNGAQALPKLQEVEVSEQGRLFANKENFVAFLERYYTSEVTVGNTVQQIFSDDGGATALPFSTFQFQFNDIDITNNAMVTTPTTRASSSDSTSITANGLQSKKIDTILSTFDQANSMAAGIVANNADPVYRVAPITVYPEKNTTRWDEVLGLELGYRCQFEITPMAISTQNAQEVTLEQIEWSIVDELWTLTVAGSPVRGTGTPSGWFVIGTSLIGSTTDLIGY